MMNLERSSSPVNLAYRDPKGEPREVANILPPYPEFKYSQNERDIDFNNLKEFRSRILEMDDEIRQLKNNEREKQSFQQKNDYQPQGMQFRPNNTLRNDYTSNAEILLQQQTSRIEELQRQIEELKSVNYQMKQDQSKREGAYMGKIYTEDKNNDQKSLDYERELDEQISRKVGSWTPRNPYQGPMDNLYFPFGSSGGGAPRRDPQGRIVTTMTNESNSNMNYEEKKQKQYASQYLQESQQQDILQQRLKRLQDRQQNREQKGELADVISSFKGGRPKRDPLTGILTNNYLPSTDITNVKLASPRPSSPPKIESSPPIPNHLYDNGITSYGLELTKAAKERQILKQLEKLREQQEAKQHLEAWNNIWGSRENLNYLKNNYPNHGPNKRSSHRNFYELPYQTM